MVIGHLTGRWEGCAGDTVSVGCLSVAGITLPVWPGLGSLNVLSVATCLNLEPLAGSGQGQGVGRQIMAAVPGP